MMTMMMAAKTAVVFSGRNGLDFSELRAGVMRIPDITLRLREAQTILDSLEMPRVDLLSVVSSDDELFFRNIQLKSLCSAIVQVGLFDRYMKTQKRPDYMVGNSNGDSAMMVCAGRMTFRELVENSQAVVTMRKASAPVVAAAPAPQPIVEKHTERFSEKVITLPTAALVAAPLHAAAMPLLSGLTLTEYHALESRTTPEGTSYQPMPISSMELRKLIATLHTEHELNRFINIGPASALRGSDYRMVGAGDIESLDSIELDPMLGWFWRGVRPQAAALAQ